MLFDKLWAQVKGAEHSGKLTVEEALDCATRLPQALFCSMMECLAENGEDPQVIVVQVARLHEHMQDLSVTDPLAIPWSWSALVQ